MVRRSIPKYLILYVKMFYSKDKDGSSETLVLIYKIKICRRQGDNFYVWISTL
jgi:hypothetical protein